MFLKLQHPPKMAAVHTPQSDPKDDFQVVRHRKGKKGKKKYHSLSVTSPDSTYDDHIDTDSLKIRIFRCRSVSPSLSVCPSLSLSLFLSLSLSSSPHSAPPPTPRFIYKTSRKILTPSLVSLSVLVKTQVF